ncbi:M4 family metallopeptidase [Aquimarina sp. 2-A2]|uniref:M4 family metallopeptidase n=1 Tax=Aquimarina sp. 2-A2 TaxID=3382644 RepID=UPI00387F1C1D
MKKNYKKVLVASAIGLSFFCAEAQEKKQGDSFVQPPKFMKIDGEATQNKSAQSILSEYIGLNHANSYTKMAEQVDQLGITHKRFQQRYKGVKVEYGIAVLDAKGNKTTSLHGEYYNVDRVNTTPSISKSQALQRAINHTGAQKYLWQDAQASEAMNNYDTGGELVILPDFQSENEKGLLTNYNLAYKFDIYATQPLSRGYLYIDAHTGEALYYDAIIKHLGEHSNSSTALKTVHLPSRAEFEAATLATGSAATRYSGTQPITARIIGSSYALRDNTRGNGVNTYNSGQTQSYPTTDFTDADNNWTAAEFDNAAKDNAALDAHWGAERTYDYWQAIHARNSFDGAGAEIKSWVHYGSAYDNAFWNGSVMTYGDGSSNGSEGNGSFDALTSLDVAAHEIGHAVTTNTANLAYQRESGGLNEGFSDIWGAAVEHFAKGNGNDLAPDASIWLIGDEIDRRTGSAALRSMSNPNSAGDPDTYGGTYWKNPNCGFPTQSNDYCGVHTNSGVLNYWFYLSTVGGSGTNDVGSSFNVSGIGILKAAKVAYRTLSVYLSANSTFADARAGAIQSAKDLYGVDSAEEIAITNAWYAVGVGSEYGTGGGISYCSSKGNSVVDEYISRVQVGTINKTSGASSAGYADYTSTATDLNLSTAYSITITPTWTGRTYREGYAVWIDYNQDGDFTDAGELVWSKSASTTTPVSGSFTVPSSAASGATRMRVSMKYNGIPSSCETFSYGEVEDYTVTLGSATVAPAVTGIAEASDIAFSIYPNPVNGNELSISMKNPADATFEILNILGKRVTAGVVKGAIDVQNLSAGMYILRVNTTTETFTKRFVKQ